MLGLLNFRKKKAMPAIDCEKPVAEARYVVIDTELTGLDEKKDSIVSIGALRMIGGKIDLSNYFYRLVNPRTGLSPESVVIHGITPSEVVEKPDIEEVLTEFLEFCGDDILVGHCVSIDTSFLNKEMMRIFGSTMRNYAVDTFAMFSLVREKLPSHRMFVLPPRDYRQLYDIAKSLGIPVSGAHNALMDAFITAQLFQRLIPMLSGLGIRTVGNLLKLRSGGGDVFKTSCEIGNL